MRIAIITVDTREAPFLADVVRRSLLAFKGGQHFAWCAASNAAWTRRTFPHAHCNVLEDAVAPTTPERFSTLMLTDRIWATLASNHITHALVVQDDVLVLRTHVGAHEVRSWTQYDYIGAPWAPDNAALCVAPGGVGNGGCSLRSVRGALAVVGNPRAVEMHTKHGWPEDVVFAAFSKRVAPRRAAAAFACEVPIRGLHRKSNSPFALHAAAKFCSPELLRAWQDVVHIDAKVSKGREGRSN